VVVEEPDHVTVRLPFFCSVQVRYQDDRLNFEPYFGITPRTRATVLKLGALVVLCTGGIKLAAPFSVGLGSLAVLAGVYDVIRWLITEQAITRTQMIWTLMPRGGAGLTRELTAGMEIPQAAQREHDPSRASSRA
jgi:Flp pilus assembly protein TadB